MEPYRSRYLKRSVAILFLFASMAGQIQVLFACDLMDNGPTRVCCCAGDMSDGCDMGGGCAMNDAPRSDGCCELVIDTLSAATASGPTQPTSQVCMLEAPQPPPTISASSFLPIPIPDDDVSQTSPPVYASRPRAATYLITRRLRI